MKKTWILVAFCFFWIILLGVSGMRAIRSRVDDTTIEVSSAVDSETEVVESTTEAETDIYDWHFIYNGTKFTLPMKTSDLVVIDSQPSLFDEMLQPGTSTTAYTITPDGAQWDLNIVNRGEFTQAAKDCDIIAISASCKDAPSDVDLIGPDGSALGSDYSVHDEEKFPAHITSKTLGGHGPLVCICLDNGRIIGEITYLYEEGQLIGIRIKHEGY